MLLSRPGTWVSVLRMGAERRTIMLRAALAFLIIAFIAAIFGFGGIATAAVGVAKILFFIFLALFLLAVLAGWGLFRAV